MDATKTRITAFGAAVLAACAPPQQPTDPNVEAEIVCSKESRIDSRIKDETCVRVVRHDPNQLPGADDPFSRMPQPSDRQAPQDSIPGPPPIPEGTCGGTPND